MVQSYPWATSQHIKVLELAAYLNFLHMAVRDCGYRSVCLSDVFDSRALSCVATKGRSISKAINNILRRSTALILADDLYPFSLLIISASNFADGQHE